MTKGREIHCYDYVNRPHEQVRGAMSKDPRAVFQSATKAAASRAQSTEAEINLAASWIAERLIRLDERVSPGIMGRSRFRANQVSLDVDSLKGGRYYLSTGITLWIELSPGWSRLQNRSIVQLQILSMRSEVRAQSLANTGDTFLPL